MWFECMCKKCGLFDMKCLGLLPFFEHSLFQYVQVGRDTYKPEGSHLQEVPAGIYYILFALSNYRLRDNTDYHVRLLHQKKVEWKLFHHMVEC